MPTLYRKRLIPDECVNLKDDNIIFLDSDTIVTRETMFMKLIKAQGKKAYNGLKMLLYQGVSAYELWNDCKITKEEADEVYKCLQKELGINE